MVEDVAIERQRGGEQIYTETGQEEAVLRSKPSVKLAITPVLVRKPVEEEAHSSRHVLMRLKQHMGLPADMTAKTTAQADLDLRIVEKRDSYGVKFGLLKNFNEMLMLSALL